MERFSLFPLLLLLFFTFFWEIFNLDIVFHELGHYLIGRSFGWDCEITLGFGWGKTTCRIPGVVTRNQLLLYRLGGIFAELSVALFFLLTFYFSAWGGLVLLKVGLSHFFLAYESDLKGVPPSKTGLEFLLSPEWRFSILLVSFLMWSISFYCYYKLWEGLANKE